MPRSSRDEEFSAFVQTRRTGLVRSACLLTAGDTHLAEDLVQTALAQLADSDLVELDPDRKAAMVSNLMVVLSGDHSPAPVINTGTLYT